MSLVPGLGIAKGMALTLRRFFEPKVTVKYPEDRRDPPHKFRGRLQLLYDEWGTLKCETCFQCAQACPIECIDMGGIDTRGRYHVHWGAPETYGERREESALRRSGRTVPGPRLPAVRRGRPGGRSTASSRSTTTIPAQMLQILEATQAAYGYLPVAALKRISQRTGRLVRDDLRHGQLLQPPALRARRRRPPRPRRSTPTGRPRRPTWPPWTRPSPAPRARRTRAGRQAGAGLSRWRTSSRPRGLADDPARARRRGRSDSISMRPSAPAHSTGSGGSIRNLGATATIATIAASGLRGRGGAGFPGRGQVADGGGDRRARAATSWSTATARTRRPARTGSCSSATRSRSSRARPSPPSRSARPRRSSRSGPTRPRRSGDSRPPSERPTDAGFLGFDVLGSGHDIAVTRPAGPGRLHARRGDRPAQGARGQARPARAAAAASGRARPVRHADRRPQRPDRSPPCRGSSATAPRRSRRSARRTAPARSSSRSGRRPATASPRSRSGRRCARSSGSAGSCRPVARIKADPRRRPVRRPAAARPARHAVCLRAAPRGRRPYRLGLGGRRRRSRLRRRPGPPADPLLRRRGVRQDDPVPDRDAPAGRDRRSRRRGPAATDRP